MKIVTSGGNYLDIDAYGGCVGYAALLRQQGEAAVAVSEASYNDSIPPLLRELEVAFETSYTPHDADEFILIDISEPQFFAPYVKPERICEVIDHHPGFEAYWQTRQVAAQIEFIGAACTLVYERWVAAGLEATMDKAVAQLLAAGILDNTLWFRANVTTPRDRAAYQSLARHAGLEASWPMTYFLACQAAIEHNLERAVVNDTKSPTFPGLGTCSLGQMAVWDGNTIVQRAAELLAIMQRHGIDQIDVISISDGTTYFVSETPRLQQYFSSLLGLHYQGSLAQSNRLWLRKEIMKQALERSNL